MSAISVKLNFLIHVLSLERCVYGAITSDVSWHNKSMTHAQIQVGPLIQIHVQIGASPKVLHNIAPLLSLSRDDRPWHKAERVVIRRRYSWRGPRRKVLDCDMSNASAMVRKGLSISRGVSN